MAESEPNEKTVGAAAYIGMVLGVLGEPELAERFTHRADELETGMTEIIRSRKMNWEDKLLLLIPNALTRREVVWMYRQASESDESIDWRKVHEAIVARWSNCAVEYIRREAALRGEVV